MMCDKCEEHTFVGLLLEFEADLVYRDTSPNSKPLGKKNAARVIDAAVTKHDSDSCLR